MTKFAKSSRDATDFPQFTSPVQEGRQGKLRAMKIPLEFRFPTGSGLKIQVESSDPLPSVGDQIVSNTGVLHNVVKRVFQYSPGNLQGIVLHAEPIP